LEKISRGEFSKAIFLKLRGLTSLVVDIVVVGVFEPKTIPHLYIAPVVQKHTAMLYLRLFSTKMCI
jgi:hypothetical protein